MHRLCPLPVIAFLLVGGAALAQPKARRRAPQADQNMQVRQPHAVESFDPVSGPPGTRVVIRGQEFDETTKVRFNGRWLQVSNRSARELTVTIPAAGVSDAFVLVKSGFPEVSTEKSFFVVRPPVITTFSPARGAPGTEVTLVGNHFLPTDKVSLSGKELAPSEVRSSRLVVRIPEAASSGKLGIQRGGKVVAWSRTAFEASHQRAAPGARWSGSPAGTSSLATGWSWEGPRWKFVAAAPVRWTW